VARIGLALNYLECELLMWREKGGGSFFSTTQGP
jgi:hypothetical protein